jgi:hypothetical protein
MNEMEKLALLMKENNEEKGEEKFFHQFLVNQLFKNSSDKELIFSDKEMSDFSKMTKPQDAGFMGIFNFKNNTMHFLGFENKEEQKKAEARVKEIQLSNKEFKCGNMQ